MGEYNTPTMNSIRDMNNLLAIYFLCLVQSLGFHTDALVPATTNWEDTHLLSMDVHVGCIL